MSRPKRLEERGSSGARALGLQDADTTFEPRGRTRSKLRRILPLQRSRATEVFRKQGGTVERCRFTPEFQSGVERFFFPPNHRKETKNHGRKQ